MTRIGALSTVKNSPPPPPPFRPRGLTNADHWFWTIAFRSGSACSRTLTRALACVHVRLRAGVVYYPDHVSVGTAANWRNPLCFYRHLWRSRGTGRAGTPLAAKTAERSDNVSLRVLVLPRLIYGTSTWITFGNGGATYKCPRPKWTGKLTRPRITSWARNLGGYRVIENQQDTRGKTLLH